MSQKISFDIKIIDRILNKAVEEILPTKEQLRELLLSGKRIRVYQGFDPTAPTLHIGHTVMMRKLEDFRTLGHEVIFLIGDFTGRIGDPTDKSSMRVQLIPQQVNENLKLYRKQAEAIIDIDNKDNPVKVMFNNEWLGALKFQEIVEIASHFSVQQMLKRSMFQKRLDEDKPIGLHEFLYPLMQGYDSVAMDVDVEVGGNDQVFNMLAGRDLMKAYKNKEKIVIAGKLLATSDGVKMGKSEGNMITLADTPENIFGKVMAFSDLQIIPGFELLTSAELSEVDDYKARLDKGENPMALKKELAYRLTKELKGVNEANNAKMYFEQLFQGQNNEIDLPEVKVTSQTSLISLLTSLTDISKSNSAARRLIEQGGVKLNGEVIRDWNSMIDPQIHTEVKAGKKVYKLIQA